MRLAVAIQFAAWHPLRADMAFERIRWFEATRPDWVRPLMLVPDRGGSKEEAEGVWPTNRRAWGHTLDDPSATHSWVWQEDMQPCPGFWPALRHALEAAPDRIVVLLCKRAAMGKAVEAGRTWVELPDGTWGGATIMPCADAAEFLAWADASVLPELKSADARVDLWMRRTGRAAYATVPSLLQHVGDRSIMGHRGVRRTPYVALAGDECVFDPLDPDGDVAVRSVKGLNVRMFDYLREAS